MEWKNANWIWCGKDPQADEYAEFVSDFTYSGGQALLKISADSQYAAYVNGTLAAFGQYADFPYDKVFDCVDVTEFCKAGENRLAVVVWYTGIGTTSTYYPGNAALAYELRADGEVLCESGERTLARLSPAYFQHVQKSISPQLGLSFGFDLSKEDGWKTETLEGFAPAIKVEQVLPLRERPCEKLGLHETVRGVPCKKLSDTDVIFDLGRECVGFLDVEFTSPNEQKLLISYGEHLADGCVRQVIGPRDFSVELAAKPGENRYLNPFRRLGCRYLEVKSEFPLDFARIGIAPTMYPLTERPRPKLGETERKIYDLCVETLRLCMHEHYEDCPWREQALYTMDSRNQMLCGYYAFGEHRFPRACLELISKDDRPDGLLSICYPVSMDYAIPSFSLHYFTACAEYLKYSGDRDFLAEIYPKLESILAAFSSRLEDGLVPAFAPRERYWNFYEWTDKFSDGTDGVTGVPDLPLNALYSLALQRMGEIADVLGRENPYRKQAEGVNRRIFGTFWNAERGVFTNRADEKAGASQLGNALAVLCGAAGERAEAVCARLLNDESLTPVSLSMVCFKYDAWLKIDAERYAPVILAEIEKKYTKMLDFGSTTVWETEIGESNFGGAESLCHGWSAMPVYYYNILEKFRA